MSDRDYLEPPPEEVDRPDSPIPPRTRRLSNESPHTPGSGGRGSNGPSSNSAATAYNVMRKWNLKFSGTRGKDAETFLQRIEEGRKLVPVSDEDILRCLPFFLTGIALYWFRGKKDRLTSWATFKHAWRTRFSDPDFQFALRDEIMRRTQGKNEPVADYLTCLNALFDRVSPPWSEAEKVSVACRNLIPRLQIAVRRDEIEDVEALEYFATRAESSHTAAHRYRAPPTPEKSLFPDLAYRTPRNSSKHGKYNESVAALNTSDASSTSTVSGSRKKKGGPKNPPSDDSSVATASTSATTSRPKPARATTAKCWNCDATGHLSRDCEAAPKMHCYRCGRAEVTLRTCPDCSGKD
ncbi:unnamed protein product [Lasius platythorax]|uniref:CCHC-type domain-containing protein n=1 Tax=Lasius platythorax TaxID=488582 RepID=A0AAV2MWS8_9HYME